MITCSMHVEAICMLRTRRAYFPRSFFQQLSSWSPLQTSLENVQKLLTLHTVSPVILDALYSFGAKVTGDDDPLFNLCHQEIHFSSEKMPDSYYGNVACSVIALDSDTDFASQRFAISFAIMRSTGGKILKTHGL